MRTQSQDNHSVNGRRIIISGGTSGIGAACAGALADCGAAVWVLGSRAETVAKALAEMPKLAGGTACDVTDADAVHVTVAGVKGTLGGLDGAFVNAGIDGVGAACLDLTTDDLRRVLDVNVVGAFAVAREAAMAMPAGGRIVFNASVNALRPERMFADYNASKAAVLSLSQTMAIELASSGIVVTTICPGYIPTAMTQRYLDDPTTAAELLRDVPAGRFGKLAEVAELVCFLLSEKAGYMAGAVVSIDGGRGV
jgi:gluconate 5-dehydrogenase